MSRLRFQKWSRSSEDGRLKLGALKICRRFWLPERGEGRIILSVEARYRVTMSAKIVSSCTENWKRSAGNRRIVIRGYCNWDDKNWSNL